MISWRCHTDYFRQVFLGTLRWIGEGSMQTGEMLAGCGGYAHTRRINSYPNESKRE